MLTCLSSSKNNLEYTTVVNNKMNVKHEDQKVLLVFSLVYIKTRSVVFKWKKISQIQFYFLSVYMCVRVWCVYSCGMPRSKLGLFSVFSTLLACLLIYLFMNETVCPGQGYYCDKTQ